MKKFPITILFLTLAACSTIETDYNKIEKRDNGLTYYKGTTKLVNGTVTRKFETGQTAERLKFKDGKQVGNWFTYGYAGEDFMHGYSVELDKEIIDNNKSLNLNNSTISITTEGDYKYAELSIPGNALSPNKSDLVKLNNEILAIYENRHKFEDIILSYKQFQYRFKKYTYTIEVAKFDTIKGDENIIINIHK